MGPTTARVYSKNTSDYGDRLIGVVNLDPLKVQEGIIELDLAKLGLTSDQTFLVHDLLTNQTWSWKGSQNYVRLDPQIAPAHLFVVRVPVFKEVAGIEPYEMANTVNANGASTVDTAVEMPALKEKSEASDTVVK